jgi:Putative auto-transporter adhesin, head GIN domain
VSIAEGGDGDAELGDLVASDGHAVLSGSGRIVIEATRSLDASVTGTGDPVRG